MWDFGRGSLGVVRDAVLDLPDSWLDFGVGGCGGCVRFCRWGVRGGVPDFGSGGVGFVRDFVPDFVPFAIFV